ncbi:MAG TPA: hypothetical protein DD671_01920 [Balneolaceae bacterium]|nr:hypothetical protein [Balneolaceae bacterium]
MNYLSKLFLFGSVLLFAVSCSSTQTATEPEANAPTENEETETTAEAVTATETWHLAPANASPYYGTGVEKAYAELLADRSPRKKVIVAIIDSGTDIHQEDLQTKIWTNKDEILGNDIDDDGNGYVDDMHGWNFIGGPDSTHVDKDTYEVVRIYDRLSDKYEGVSEDSVAEENQDEYAYFQEIKEAYQKRVERNQRELQQVSQTR